MKMKHDTIRVFTPDIPAELTFVERKQVNNKLVNAIRTPGKQIVVYGENGSGKTTLLTNKLNQLYEGYISTSCTGETTVEHILRDGFDQLGKFYISQVERKKSISIGGEIKNNYALIANSIKIQRKRETNVTEVPIIPPDLTVQLLAKFFGESKYAWVLEDFHKVRKSEKKRISDLLKVFANEAQNAPSTKVIIIGAVESAGEIAAFSNDMNRRIYQIKVDLMTNEEISEIILRGSELLNLTFEDNVKAAIVMASGFRPSRCHQLCLNICQDLEINETVEQTVKISMSDFEKSIGTYHEAYGYFITDGYKYE